MSDLFKQIGEENIRAVVEDFYDKAFSDPLISHFFFGKDKQRLIEMQVTFSAILLGSKEHSYQGRPMQKAHSGLPFKNVHFNRRQVLMRESLEKKNIPPALATEWLNLEEKFRALIVKDGGNCQG